MKRILAIDYGIKRSGLAWTDPLGMFATRLDPIDTRDLMPALERYVSEGPVGRIILGWPTNFDGTATHATPFVEAFHKQVVEKFPTLEVELFDEQMTTTRAKQAMLEGGASRKQRRDKHLINSLSAVILLQDYLEEQP